MKKLDIIKLETLCNCIEQISSTLEFDENLKLLFKDRIKHDIELLLNEDEEEPKSIFFSEVVKDLKSAEEFCKLYKIKPFAIVILWLEENDI